MPSDQKLLGGDAPLASRFLFEVDGVEIGIFREVTGLHVTVSVLEINEGGQNGFSHKVPGRMSWPHLVFRRGVTSTDNLFEWFQRSSGEGFAGAGSRITKNTGAVTAMDDAGNRLRSWDFADVFPVRWKGPDFVTGSNDVLEEELEIAHHGFRAKTQPAGTS